MTGQQTIGIIIVDHGSRRAESNLMREQFAAQVQAAGPSPIVEPAHMELAEPSIATAFDRCASRGATHIIVAPYFLGPGRHWDADIPNLTADAAKRHPGATFKVAAPIGLHPLMFDVIRTRVEESRGV